VTFELDTPFPSNARLLPDVLPTFKKLCDPDNRGLANETIVTSTAVIANLAGHNDGRRDIVVGVWCQPPIGTTVNELTKSGLIVLVQRDDGSFFDATRQMFGVDILDVGGGVPWRALGRDLNGDGYDEIFFAITGEDGRSLPEGFTGYNRQNLSLTSDVTGRYRHELLGWPSYNVSAKFVRSTTGSFDILTDTIGYGGKRQAFRLVDDLWRTVDDYDGAPSFESVFFSSVGAGRRVDSAIGLAGSTDKLAYYALKAGGGWMELDRRTLGSLQKAPLATWNGDAGLLDILRIDGSDYGFIQFGDNCQIGARNDRSGYSLFAAAAQKIVGGYTPGRLLTESDPKDFSWNLLMLAYEIVDGKLTPKSIKFRNFVVDQNFYTIACEDITEDNRDDIVISNWLKGQKPTIYLATADDEFSLVDPAVLPHHSVDFNGSITLYQDIDGDQVRDLVYIAGGPVNGATSLRYQVLKGLRKLSDQDL